VSKILIAEDDNDLRKFIVDKILSLGSVEIIEMENGLDAFNYIKKESGSIDVIITDNNMPMMTGVELLERVSLLGNGASFKAIILVSALLESIESKLPALAELVSTVAPFYSYSKMEIVSNADKIIKDILFPEIYKVKRKINQEPEYRNLLKKQYKACIEGE